MSATATTHRASRSAPTATSSPRRRSARSSANSSGSGRSRSGSRWASLAPSPLPSLGRGAAPFWPTRARLCGASSNCAGRVSLALVETSPVLRAPQKRDAATSPAPLPWCEDDRRRAAAAPAHCLANEFIDALPVRQLCAPRSVARAVHRLDDGGGFSFCLGRPPRRGIAANVRSLPLRRRHHRRNAPSRGLSAWLARTARFRRAARRAVRRLWPRRERHRRYAAGRPPPSLRRPARSARRSRSHRPCRFRRAEARPRSARA